MSRIGYGYGSEWHLLRFLGYHRDALNKAVRDAIRVSSVEWLDAPLKLGVARDNRFPDAEWRGVDFLPIDAEIHNCWRSFWPQTGNVPCWDGVGRVKIERETEWLLVEAKAHTEELKTTCGAKKEGGFDLINTAFDQTKRDMGVALSGNWLAPYYQYANRLVVLNFLLKHNVPARLLFICFVGDSDPKGRWACPQSVAEWKTVVHAIHEHLGLTGSSETERRLHHLFLSVR